MTTHKFWRKTPFSYIVSYSFNRGEKLNALHHAAKQQIAAMRQELLTAPAIQLPAMRENLRSLERERDLTLMPLTEALKAFQITALPVARIAAEIPIAARLAAIMAIPVREQNHWMCAPIYRDALAFYDKQDTLCGVLNICFDCDKMMTHQQKEVAADTATYQELKRLLTELGHAITEQ